MWRNYRKWKIAAIPVLVGVAYLLLDPDKPDWRSFVGIGICVVLVGAYIVEEVYWAVRASGRPCIHCGHVLLNRPFWNNNCPNCGKPFG